MPMIIEHIDAIARKKGRDVLFLDFPQRTKDIFKLSHIDWNNVPIRKQIINWMNDNDIEWSMCGFIADENSIIGGYYGRIYVDVPFDTENPIYIKLANYLETPEGKIKHKGVTFNYMPLEMAMKNSHHDVPGFWEHRAENF